MSEPLFFATPEELRAWFAEHHETETEASIGFHKKGSGLASVTWSEAVDEALCVGWIDGVIRRIDDKSYSHRFTPRKPTSTWSAVNIAKAEKLTAEGRMLPAGLAAFERRTAENSKIYAHENLEAAVLTAEHEARFHADEAAWAFFSEQPESYRRTAIHLVNSAKRPETRERRLRALIEDSAAGRRIKQLRRG